MKLSLECTTGDNTELIAFTHPDEGKGLVLIGVGVNGVCTDSTYLSEEQVIELIEYLEAVIVGG